MKYLILPQISDPSDLAYLDFKDLRRLAAEIRDTVIETVSRNGGHLASNLGVVELTIALLREFDFNPKKSDGDNDVIIFDVGHQSYTYKILTGRYERFASLRQKNGLAGFPKRSESPWDYFDTGHSSTSISAALGICRARSAQNKGGKVIAFVGDGAMGAGMAFEALNDIAGNRENLVIVLNDNMMSIDGNVGGLSKNLEKLRVSPPYLRFKERTLRRLQKSPLVRESFIDILRGIKSFDRLLWRKRGLFFESMGFKYYGPVDGHDFVSLEKHLKSIHEMKGPVILHALTVKGCGYIPAEENPANWHGVAPFVIEAPMENGSKTRKAESGDAGDFTPQSPAVCTDSAGSIPQSPVLSTDAGASTPQSPAASAETYTSLMGKLLCKKAEKNEKIFAISAAMTAGTGLTSFAKNFPDRFYDVGIAEQHAVTMAAGLAAGGMKAFVALYSTFMQRAFDQAIHDVVLQKLPVTFLLDHSGFVSGDGETHQGFYDIGMFNSLPNVDVFAPIYREDVSKALDYALESSLPSVILYPKAKIHPKNPKFSLPKDLFSPRIYRPKAEGREIKTEITLGVLGYIADAAQEAADLLLEEGILSEVFAFTASKNMQIGDIIKSVERTHCLISAEEAPCTGGFGVCLSQLLYAEGKSFSSPAIGISNLLPEQNSRTALLKEAGLDSRGLARQIKTIVEAR